MLAEKLLLNLLIILAPILLFSVVTDNNRKFDSPYICGLLQSIAALTCMLFSYSSYGMSWDFRFIPLMLAFLYGGRVAGAMVMITIIVTRMIMGGETILFGVFACILTGLIPFLLSRNFFNFSPNKRVLLSVLSGVWSILLCYLSLTIYRFFEGNIFKLEIHLPDLILVACVQTISIALAAKLNEGLIEKNKMKDEILRAEKLNTLSELAASIAHEVRNPLTVVKGFLQLMQQDKEESKKNREYLSLVLSELGRAESIINDYLNFAKPKFEKLEEFPLVTILSEVILLLEPFAAKSGVQLESNLEVNDFTLFTDRNQLKQALVNLIKNGIEATPDGGKVVIHLKTDAEQATILISDTGKGMNEEQLGRIGTLFYTTKDKGTGLGTSVSLRIIEAMKGKITYQSQPGVGTDVRMVLPMGKKEMVV